MTFPAAIRNGWLDDLTVSHLAAFDGDPAGAGTEVSTSRVAATFGAASNGARALSGTPEIPVPAGEQVTHVAAFSASSGGTLEAVYVLPAPDVFGNAGVVRVTSWSLTVSDS